VTAVGEYILALDCGTTATKVAVFDTSGVMLACSTQEYALETPSPLVAELPAETFWAAFAAGARDAVARSGVAPKQIRAVGISAQGETMVLLDRAGNPLMNAISWMDSRAGREAALLTGRFGGDVYPTTGQVSFVPTWPAAKLLWVRQNRPELFTRLGKVLLIEDWLLWRMTGVFATEDSLVCSTAYWDLRTRRWWPEMLAYLGVSESLLPEIRRSGEYLGKLTATAAEALGLAPDTAVCMGALDQACGTIGVGNTRPGIVTENTGAALAICALQARDRLAYDPRAKMPVHCSALSGQYMYHTFTSGGIFLRWFRDRFCGEELAFADRAGLDAYDLLSELAASAPAGCDGLVALPHLQGAMAPEDNPNARGVFYGFTLRHGKAHFVRAVMEAIAFIVKRNLDTLEGIGVHADELRVLGGGARSDVWNQLKADATGKRIVRTASSEAACLGAAILAGVGAGLFPCVEQAAESMVRVVKTYEPNAENRGVYAEAYRTYVALYESLCGLFGRKAENA
jgi:sugar (pentulose or hexulose) kinase